MFSELNIFLTFFVILANPSQHMNSTNSSREISFGFKAIIPIFSACCERYNLDSSQDPFEGFEDFDIFCFERRLTKNFLKPLRIDLLITSLLFASMLGLLFFDWKISSSWLSIMLHLIGCITSTAEALLQISRHSRYFKSLKLKLRFLFSDCIFLLSSSSL